MHVCAVFYRYFYFPICENSTCRNIIYIYVYVIGMFCGTVSTKTPPRFERSGYCARRTKVHILHTYICVYIYSYNCMKLYIYTYISISIHVDANYTCKYMYVCVYVPVHVF